MAHMPTAERMTADEFLAQEWPDRRRRELIDGVVVVHDVNRVRGDMTNVIAALVGWTRQGPRRGLSMLSIDVQLGSGEIAAPDVLWYSHDRIIDVRAQPPYPMPDIAIEVREPGTGALGAEKSAYERAGLRELWVIEQEEGRVVAFRRSAPAGPIFDVSVELQAGDVLTSDLLPGFLLPVTEILARQS